MGKDRTGGGKQVGGCPFEEKCWIKEGQLITRARNVYEVKCHKITAVYTRTTGHSIHKRGWEAHKGPKGKNMAYAITKHYSLDHPEGVRKGERLFELKVIDETRALNFECYFIVVWVWGDSIWFLKWSEIASLAG